MNMENSTQLFALFAFGLAITGIVFMGIVRAREYESRNRKASRG
jgi:hypothetical protein